jgi:hypothetical protein
MGRRHRQREKLAAPTTDYTDAEGNVLTLRGALTPATRQEYAAVLAGERTGLGGGEAAREDAWQRGVEFLFERLAARWVVHDLPIERQKELLGRYRLASHAERAWIREVLREHLAASFPDLEAP